MNKKVLIISPYFPPSNTADMQRVRTSLPYFHEFGWDATVVSVDEQYTDTVMDELLTQSIPPSIRTYKINALNKKRTSKFGLGSLALRSMPFYFKKVNALLKTEKFDLVYFSTTQFMVCALGAYWKKRFNVPYVIDMQDPWYAGRYTNRPNSQRPPKYLAAYTLHKYLEQKAMKRVGGLISVSEGYIEDLIVSYSHLKDIPTATITFGAFEPDINIAVENRDKFVSLLQPGYISIVYIGRGGADMHEAIKSLFEVLSKDKAFAKLKFYFIGTSYAPTGTGVPTILPLAKQFGVEKQVIEITDRIGHYHALATLMQADALFIPGSDASKYTASKIFPFLLTKKPMLAIFNSQSSALKILKEYGVKNAFSFDKDDNIGSKITAFLNAIINGTLIKDQYNLTGAENYSAKKMTKLQCSLFDKVTDRPN